MTDTTLLPCPICRSDADGTYPASHNVDWVGCSDPSCILASHPMPVDAWQSLPRQSDELKGIVEEMVCLASDTGGRDSVAFEAAKKIRALADRLSRIADKGDSRPAPPAEVNQYRCSGCGAVGPNGQDQSHWVGGPVSGGGFMVTHWCSGGEPGPMFAQGWHPAIPVHGATHDKRECERCETAIKNPAPVCEECYRHRMVEAVQVEDMATDRQAELDTRPAPPAEVWVGVHSENAYDNRPLTGFADEQDAARWKERSPHRIIERVAVHGATQDKGECERSRVEVDGKGHAHYYRDSRPAPPAEFWQGPRGGKLFASEAAYWDNYGPSDRRTDHPKRVPVHGAPQDGTGETCEDRAPTKQEIERWRQMEQQIRAVMLKAAKIPVDRYGYVELDDKTIDHLQELLLELDYERHVR